MADDYSSDASTTGRLALYGSVTGRIEIAGDRDWFVMDLDRNLGYAFALVPGAGSPAGQRLDLAVFPSTGVTTMAIYSTEQDFYHESLPGEPVAPHQTARYHVQVKGSLVGDYSLRVTPVADDMGNSVASAAPVSATGQASGRLDYLYDRDYFKLPAAAGLTYQVKLDFASDQQALATAARPVLDLVDANGAAVAHGYSWDQDTATLTAAASGTSDSFLRIQAGSFTTLPQGEKLDYTISMSLVDTTAPKLVPGAVPVNGTLQLNFSEAVRLGAGVISLVDSSRAVTDTFDVQDVGRVTVSGSTVTLHPGHVLFPGTYTLRLDASSVTDLAGNATNPYVAPTLWATALASKEPVQGGTLTYTTYSGTQGERDTVVYKGAAGDYSIYKASGSGNFKILKLGAGNDTLSNIDRIFFTGGRDVVALSMDGEVGRAYRLYQAAFDRKPDNEGLGFWIAALEGGVKLNQVAGDFIGSAEFQKLYGVNQSNAAFVGSLYQNVLHRAGDTGGVTFWNSGLDSGVSRADVLTAFSESAENQSTAATLVGNGFVYTMYG